MQRIACVPEGAGRRSAIGALAVLVCLACREGEEGLRNVGATVTLTPDAIFADDSLGWIGEIALVGDRLVALDVMGSPAIHVVDLADPRRLGSYGREGDGPGEFRDLEQIVTGVSASPDEIWILDGSHQRLTRLSVTDIERGGVPQPEIFRMEGPNAESLVRTPEGLWFSGGRIPDGRVARYNLDWSYDRTIVGFPPEAIEMPGVPFRQIYESWVVADPAGGRLAAATLMAGLLEIFDYDGVLLARAAVPDPFQPAWDEERSRNGYLTVSHDTRYGFADLTATRRYLYGVFSGRRLMGDGFPWESRQVQVYTWDGDYVKTLHLDRAAEAIAVDESDTWLYASGSEPSPWLARFRLPEP